MDIATLEALGIDRETLADRIVDQCVAALLSSTGFDEDGEKSTYESRFKQAIQKKVLDAVNEKIVTLAERLVVPRVGELIEGADFQVTSRYGEPKGPKLTFKEYLAERAQNYMSEPADINGKAKHESDGYNWRECGPRLTVLMRIYIADSMQKAAQSAITDVNKVIAKGVEKAAKDAIEQAATSLKVSVAA